MPALSAHITTIQRVPNVFTEHITYMGRAECFLTYLCLALMMRGVFVNFDALLTRNAVSKRCVFDIYTWFIYNTLYIRLKLAGFSHILIKFMDAQRRTALIFVTQGMGCASCMCDWGIKPVRTHFHNKLWMKCVSWPAHVHISNKKRIQILFFFKRTGGVYFFRLLCRKCQLQINEM